MSMFIYRFLNDEMGTTAIEYAMIAVGIAVAIIGTVNALGTSVLTSKFQAVTNAVAP